MEAPPIIRTAQPRPVWWLMAVVPAFAAGTILFLFNPAQNSFYPRCLLYTTTGLYCPGCGSLRALHQLAHGHLATAFHYNAILVTSLPFVVFFGLRLAVAWVNKRPLPRFALTGSRLTLLICIVAVFTILRNIPYVPFIWLAPPG